MYLKKSQRRICSAILIILGVVLIIGWTPIEIWLIMIGIIFISLGINIYK